MYRTLRCFSCFLVFCSFSLSAIGQSAPVIAKLSVKDNNNCVQKVNGKKYTKFKVDHAGGTVKWVAPDAKTSCQVKFTNDPDDCPFYVAGQNYCEYTCSHGEAASMAATGPKKKKYNYRSLAIGGQSCRVGNNGIVLDH